MSKVDKSIEESIRLAKSLANKPAEEKAVEAAVTAAQEAVKATMVSAVKTVIRDYWYATRKTAVALYMKHAEPVVGAYVTPVYKYLISPLVRCAKWLWKTTDQEEYDGKWKKKAATAGRATLRGIGMMLVALSLIQLVPNFLGGEYLRSATDYGMGVAASTAHYMVTEPLYDGARMLLWMKHEKVVLDMKQLDAHAKHQDSWVISGKKVDPETGKERGVTYKVQPSFAHNIWSWFNTGSFVFMPKEVVGHVPNGGTQMECDVDSYGELWRLGGIVQGTPQLLRVKSCVKISAEANMPAANYATVNFNGKAVANTPVQMSVPAVTITVPAAKAG